MVANLKRHRFLGRPVKPLAIGMILALFPIALNGWLTALGSGRVLHPTDDDMAIGAVSTIALTAMVIGWIIKSQSVFEASLLFIVGAFSARAFLVLFTDQYPLEFMLPLGVAVFAAGAYVLERDGQRRGEQW